MRRCPTTEELAAYQADNVTTRTRTQLAQHIAACTWCQQEMAALKQTCHTLARLPQPALPPDLWPGVAQRLQTRRNRLAWWRVLTSAGVAASLFVGWLTLRGYQGDAPPTAPTITSQYVRDHQLLSSSDPLTDRASLGLALASYRSEGE